MSSKTLQMQKQTSYISPIIGWAIFGIIATIFSLSIFGQWVFSAEEFLAVPITALDTMPQADIYKIRIFEVISSSIALIALYIFLIRPWLKTGRAPILGLMLIGALISYVIDTTVNYHGYFMAWNVHSINWGTWAAFFPGHTGPTRFAEALFWGPPMYLYFGVLLGLIQYMVIHTAQKRFGFSLVAAVLTSMVVAFFLDLLAEWGIIFFTQAYAWARTISWLTLLPGSQFQFPLYESFAVAIYGTIYSSLIKSSKENRISYIEQGVDRLTSELQLPARFFAATGLASLATTIYFGSFFLFSCYANSQAALPHYLMFLK
ncbi:MAG: spirocyclase, AveC family [Desulfobacterium sp.]|nr:spirocyclase, AveC family [Desulfobacterium sp.]MBU3995911.1 spirocyclase AveC family protein [Actinomycetota bacterium]MBU4036539.1 spirocyclase AveC family protein [Pseudomonadota bacterium]